MLVEIPVSVGELVDKVTILRIKAERIAPERRPNVERELALLEEALTRAVPSSPELEALRRDLHAINARLWEIEDGKRECERRQDFGPAFVALARAVYLDNDRRAAIKRRINLLTGSEIVEEKSYPA